MAVSNMGIQPVVITKGRLLGHMTWFDPVQSETQDLMEDSGVANVFLGLHSTLKTASYILAEGHLDNTQPFDL